MNNAFFPTNNYILENIHKIQKIPGVIVQGRYDVVCPARSAWDLHRAWPEPQIKIIPDAGHAASEIGIRSALINATDDMKRVP
jgi:proline iminopeptidase